MSELPRMNQDLIPHRPVLLKCCAFPHSMMNQKMESMKAKPLWSLEQLGQEEALDVNKKAAGSLLQGGGIPTHPLPPLPAGAAAPSPHRPPSSQVLIQVLKK